MEQEIQLQPELINVTTGGGAVDSVNGQTGDVVLTTSDLENTSGYQTSSEVESAISTAVGAEQTAREQADGQLQNNITVVQNSVTAETTARENADTALQGQIDAITASSDVKDIVGTHAELEDYDTSTLGNNDIIKVLQDETQDGATTYYRWNASTNSFSLIGEEGPYYTKSQTDTLLNAKQDDLTAGANISISGSTISATDTTYTAGNGLNLTGTAFSADTTVLATQSDLSGKQNTLTAGNNIQITGDTISATDTTYSAFVGTDGTSAGTAGLVPAPATTDADKFLKSDGTWDTAGGGSSVTVVQSVGTSTTDVMSQNATTNMVYADPSTQQLVCIGNGANAGTRSSSQDRRVAIGKGATATGHAGNIAINGSAVSTNYPSIAIGGGGSTKNYTVSLGGNLYNQDGEHNVLLGYLTTVNGSYRKDCVALGYNAACTRSGEVNVGAGSTTNGFNSTSYRVIGGVHDGQDAHDVVTVNQINSVIDAINSALSTNISHIGS